MAVRSDTREEILRTASRLLQTRGYTAFSYGQIAETLGVKPAAIHYHFPSKTDLGLALVERFRGRYRLWMEDGAALSATEQLDGFIAIYQRFLENGARVCPAGVLQSEFLAIPEEIQKAVGQMVKEIQTWLTGVLDQGRKSGELSFEGDAHDQAAMIGSSVMGALQMSRSLGPQHFHAVVRQLRAGLRPQRG
ncbi:MAG: TetR/AcrR family transcriptional regulator [Deltaproteobacteria bacterium]|jgi:TetR/AcrR family transcriptional repressor of nem operon|nr:TetR/AcrR family transcriptional regulator [Deltaproteobacteria bacterium]